MTEPEPRASALLLVLAVALLVALASLSCAKGQLFVPVALGEPTLANVQKIFDRHGCADSGCHDGGSLAEPTSCPMDLRTAAASYASLVSVKSADCSICALAELPVRVVPGDSEGSCLPFIVNSNLDPSYRMPRDSVALTPDEVQLIKDWIDAGASPD